MHRGSTTLRVCSLLAIMGSAVFAGAAETTDVATLMPQDTALYVGWTPLVGEDSAEFRLARQVVEAVGRLATEEEEEAGVVVRAIGDALTDLQTCPVGIGLFDVVMVDDEPDVQVALVVVAGAKAAKLADVVTGLVSLNDEGEFGELTIQGVKFNRCQLADTLFQLVWGECDGCFIVAFGETAATKVVACLRGGAPVLAAAQELKVDREKVGARLDGRFFCLYVDAARVVTRAKELIAEAGEPLPPIVDQLIDELGISAVKSKYLHIDEADGKPRIMAFAHVDGPLRGLLKIWDQLPLVDDDLKIVPQDAYWAQVCNLDLAGLWEETQRVIEAVSPETLLAVEGAVAASAPMLGFSLTDDLLPAFGDTWALYDAPEHGGLLLTGTVLAVEVRDAERLQFMLTRGVQMLTPLLMEEDIKLKLTSAEHNGHTVHCVVVGGVPSPVALSWGFTGDRWVLGLFPQTVAAALQQVDPKTRKASILDHPDVQAARAKLPKEMQSFGFFDSKYAVRLLYPISNGLQMAGVSMLAPYGFELDLAAMPPVTDAVAKATNGIGTTSRDKDGILYASVGDGTPALAVVGCMAGGASILLPSLSKARFQAKSVKSMANLRQIGQGCMIYANDQPREQFPETLEALLDPENQYITPEALHSPLDSEPGNSYVYVAGQRAADDPRNVLAYERVEDQGKIRTLFLDCHVEAVPVERFRQVLHNTYERLGRVDEIPPQYRQR